MKISVIIPMYNVEQYLETCLESILEQSYTDLEVILIDDESSDNTLDIAKLYQEIDKRIKLICLKHGGQARARNEGICIAEGEYITFIDADDYWGKDHLKNLISSLQGCEMCIANRHINFTKKSKRMCQLFEYKAEHNYSEEEAKILVTGMQNNLPGATWLNTYNRNFLKRNNLCFDSQYSCAEDMDFFFSALMKAKNIKFCGGAEYYYRIDNEKSTINNMNAEKLLSRARICKKWYDICKVKIEYKVAENVVKRMSKEFGYLVDELHKVEHSDCNKVCLEKFLKENYYIYRQNFRIKNNFYYKYYVSYWLKRLMGICGGFQIKKD